MSKQYEAKIILGGSAEQIAHTLITIARNIQIGNRHQPDQSLSELDAYGYEDIVIHSEIKEV
jgi:hypothetical protein